jgi:hypothetical protein
MMNSLKNLCLFLIGFTFTSFAFAQGDNCAGATSLPVNLGTCQFSVASNSGLTNSGQIPVGADCQDYSGGDMWYTVVLPPSGEVTVTTQFIPGTTPPAMDINLAAYSGSCGSLSLIGCDEDSGLGFYAEIALSGTPGETLFILLWETNHNLHGDFHICANGTTTCTPPTVSFTEVCIGNNQYEVNVNISSLGDATSVDIINDGGAPSITGITTTGTETVGPFDLGQNPTLTVVHADDASCNVSAEVTDVGLTCENILTCGEDLSQTYCYQNNDNTSFLYGSPDGSPITITFLSGGLEDGLDEITIRDGSDQTGAILFQGSNGGDLSGITETATSGNLFLSVDSDLSGSCEDGSFDFEEGWLWEVSCEGCVPPSANFTVVEDCGSGTFSVDVDITALGNSASLSLTNDGGLDPITGINGTGIQNVGPFPIGSPVTITVASEGITGCSIAQGGLDFDCPAGENCDNASTIVSLTTFAASEITGDVASVNYSLVPQCVGPGNNPDPYFTFTAVGSVTYFRVETTGDFDPAVEVFDECEGQQLACVNEAGPGQRELFWVTDLTPGQDYIYRVYHAGSGNPSNTDFTTAVAHIPTVRLRPADCGATELTANSLIRATLPNPNFLLTGFVFEFTELEPPFEVYEVESPNGANPNFLMGWFTDFEYGRSYEVRVRARMYQGANLGEYGPACTISMAEAPITFLLDNFEGGSYNMCDFIKARKILGSTNYRWVFDDGQNELEYNSNSSSPICPLQRVDELQLGTSYSVSVFATDANGVESTESDPKQISMNDFVPDTEINSSLFSCGSLVSSSQVLSAVEVCAVQEYTFRFTNLSQPGIEPIEYVRPNRFILLSFVNGLLPGNTYNVAVKANSGGLEGDYGSECEFTLVETGEMQAEITGTESEVPQSFDLRLMPNPSNGTAVTLNSEWIDGNNNYRIEVYDLQGKKLMEQVSGGGQDGGRLDLTFEERLTPGIYLVRMLSSNGLTSTEKLFVEP